MSMLTRLWAKIKVEPAAVAAITSLLTAGVSLFVKNPALTGALVTVAVTFIGLRSVVVPVTKAAEVAVTAVTEAATKTAEALTGATVGVVGEVSDLGAAVVSSVTKDVVAGTVAPVLGSTVGVVKDVLGGLPVLGGVLGGGKA